MSSPSSTTSAVLGRVKACNACRQLKLRCDAHKGNYGPCSRCTKMRRDCVITSSFKRPSRQTKAEMGRELKRLRAQYELPSSPVAAAGSAHSLAQPLAERHRGEQNTNQHPELCSDGQLSITTALPENLARNVDQSSIPRSNESQLLTQTSPVDDINWSQIQENSASFAPPANAMMHQPAPPDAYASDTIPRTIGDVELDVRKIDGCLATFKEYYAPYLAGIFDCLKDPNELYGYSHFLFWTVVYVGARKYSKDPTIVESIMKPLTLLTQQSLFDPERAIPTIQSSLLLCLWPFPVNSTFKDQSHTIAGAAMQLAIQKGLPYASRKQDFFRLPLKQSEADKLFRARLWAYCLMVFQSTSLYDGFPYQMTIDAASFDRDVTIFCGLPNIVSYNYRMHRVLMNSVSTILRSTDIVKAKDSDLLNSLIGQSDSEAQSFSVLDDDDLSRFALSNARLIIRAFHFFSMPSSQRNSGLLQTYFIACELINTAVRLDKERELGSHCNRLQARAISLAAVCILRVLRSHLRLQVNPEIGEEMFFEAIRISKKHSIRSNDLDARNAIILTQLWSFSRLFQYKDGSIDGLRLLLRGRLSMSVLFDSHWWWRAEFGGQLNPYLEPENDQTAPSAVAAISSGSAIGQKNHDSSNVDSIIPTTFTNLLVEASEIPDFDWAELGDLGLNWC